MSALHLISDRDAPRHSLKLGGECALALGRVHEFCGPARHTLAVLTAARTEGPVFWIAPDWSRDRLHGAGLSTFVDPGRITFLTPIRAEDILWAGEEALRAGVVPLVVMDIPEPPPLTPIRRLHLSAEAGGNTAIGLVLCPGDGGAAGIDSRWYLAPDHSATRSTWRLERRRARTAPRKSWAVALEQGQMRLT